ncbi:MAG: TldD/PmbA family protein [Thermoplasmata archaeon YP2-bin.285]|uniref:TldD/PmbA family protein n=1 Tax=Candidatus Sysuiplasma superficiale TaxID=2823368 RepID=A0A8J8CBQ5_9ARCH|nr:TldD/PmbA family protein [Candidatus Sysuiplasma superficiale]
MLRTCKEVSQTDQEGFDLAEKALKMSSHGKVVYASATYRSSRTLQMIFRNGSLSVISPDLDYGVAVTVVTGSGKGFSSTNTLNTAGVRRAVSRAISMARSCSTAVPSPLSGKAEKDEWRTEEKIPLNSLDERQKIDMVSTIDRAVASATDLRTFRQIFLTERLDTKYYTDSEGTRIIAYDPKLVIHYFIRAVKGADSEQVHRTMGFSGGYEAFEKLQVEKQAVDDTRALKKMLENGRTAKRERLDVVCGSEVTGIACHESCGHPMEADRIMGREASQAGKSFVDIKSIGERIGSEMVTIVDDPTIPGSYGYYQYDDEGIRARRRVLYRNGQINEFLQNRESGSKSGFGSNGAGRAASYDMEPLVRMANTFLLPGEFDDSEIIGDVRKGILINGFTEWNIDDRRFNQKYVGREAYLIENGELTVPVRSPTLEITTRGFWSSVDAVGKDVRFFGGSCGKGDPMQGMAVDMGGPMIRLRNIVIK